MDDFRRRVYPITRGIWLGPFASPERRPALVEAGVTHVLNVGEAPSVLSPADGPFREVAWFPIKDLEPLPEKSALACLAALHRMVCDPGGRAYVHCIAGWNRSPTIVWLYLIACGATPEEAQAIIAARSPDAVPGHKGLVGAGLVDAVRRFGEKTFRPHANPEALEPAPMQAVRGRVTHPS